MARSVYRAVPILAILLLASCASHTPTPAEADAAAAAQAASDAAQCQANGLQPGTPKYEQCLMKVADQREQADTSDRMAQAGRLLGRPPFAVW